MRFSIPKFIWAVPTCAVLFIIGCIYSSKPTSIGHIERSPNWKTDYLSYAGKGGTSLQGPGLEVTIRPQNEGKSTGVMILPVPMPLSEWGPAPSGDKFWMTVEIRSKQTTFIADPYEIRLVIEGSTLKPTRVVQKDIEPNVYLQCIWRSGGNPRELPRDNKAQLWPPACFDVYYDIPMVSVEQNFTVRIDGVTHDTRPLDIPAIHFSRDQSASGW